VAVQAVAVVVDSGEVAVAQERLIKDTLVVMVRNCWSYYGSGGGGAGAVGANATGSAGGNGGAGVCNFYSGSSTTYAGGGGGSFIWWNCRYRWNWWWRYGGLQLQVRQE
jgi:hypothetical protein